MLRHVTRYKQNEFKACTAVDLCVFTALQALTTGGRRRRQEEAAGGGGRRRREEAGAVWLEELQLLAGGKLPTAARARGVGVGVDGGYEPCTSNKRGNLSDCDVAFRVTLKTSFVLKSSAPLRATMSR
jgi:hypothetical protein